MAKVKNSKRGKALKDQEAKLITIKVSREVVDRVRVEKANKYMPLGTFYDEAASAKLDLEKNGEVAK